jgi:hypothetical protein
VVRATYRHPYALGARGALFLVPLLFDFGFKIPDALVDFSPQLSKIDERLLAVFVENRLALVLLVARAA